jgi:hypothetical protein
LQRTDEVCRLVNSLKPAVMLCCAMSAACVRHDGCSQSGLGLVGVVRCADPLPPSQVECVWEIAAHSSLRDVVCDLIVRVVAATVSSSLGQHCVVCNTCLGCFFCSDSGRDIVGCWALVWLLLLTVFMGIIEWFAGGRREPVCGGARFVLLCNAVVVPFQCKQVARLPVTLFHRQERKRHCVT